MSKISANAVKLNNVLVINNELWVVSKPPEHVKPGKGPAYVQVELKNIKTGTKNNQRLSSSDYVEKAFLETKSMNYLYTDGDDLVLMDNDNYEQLNVSQSIIQDLLPLLTENMTVKVELFENQVINLYLPQNLTVTIDETEPVIKGATVTSSYKTAKLTNGLNIKVPPYIKSGEQVVINTQNLEFVERAK